MCSAGSGVVQEGSRIKSAPQGPASLSLSLSNTCTQTYTLLEYVIVGKLRKGTDYYLFKHLSKTSIKDHFSLSPAPVFIERHLDTYQWVLLNLNLKLYF